MGIKLATNWFDKGLVRVLGKRGVYVVSIRSITEIEADVCVVHSFSVGFLSVPV